MIILKILKKFKYQSILKTKRKLKTQQENF